MLADNLLMRGCASMEKNKNATKENYTPCSFAVNCCIFGGKRMGAIAPYYETRTDQDLKVCHGPQPEWFSDGTRNCNSSLAPQDSNIPPLLFTAEATPSTTNVLFSLQSFLILLLIVWQDLILLGWPFHDFVLNPFFFFLTSFNLLCWGENTIDSTSWQAAVVLSADNTGQNR